MNLNAPEVQEKIAEWQNELRVMTGNFRVALAAHIQPIESAKVNDLIKIVCEETGIPIEKIRMKTRKREVVVARQLLCYFSRKWYSMPYSEIGGLVGGRDHTTAMVSNTVINNLIDTNDSAVCYYVNRITKRLEERNNANMAR